MPGHPDGQNYAIWRGPYFEANPVVHIDNTHPLHAQGQVTNYASLILNVLPTITAGVNVAVEWWTDSTMSQLLSQDVWDVPDGVTLSAIIPNETNFVSIDITTTDAAGGPVIVEAAPTNTPVSNTEYLVSKNYLFNLAQFIAAGNTFTALMPYISGGAGHYYFNDVNTSGKLTFRVIITDVTGAAQSRIAEYVAPTAADIQTDTVFPDRPVAIQIVNTDAVNGHNAGYAIYILGR